jgi:hypothetical protein
MSGMDMGVETELGSLASFVRFWMAMMLPGAAAAVFRRYPSDVSGAVILSSLARR